MEGIPYVDDLITDYLIFRGYIRSYTTFNAEKIANRADEPEIDSIAEALLASVRTLDITQLASLWSTLEARFFTHLPASFASSVSAIQRSLQRTLLARAASAGRHQVVSEFLAQAGPELAKVGSGWDAWFTLPYIADPASHPVFGMYLAKTWPPVLALSLRNFLTTVFTSIPLPKLLSLDAERRERRATMLEVRALRLENEALRVELRAAHELLHLLHSQGFRIHEGPTVIVEEGKEGRKVTRDGGKQPCPTCGHRRGRNKRRHHRRNKDNKGNGNGGDGGSGGSGGSGGNGNNGDDGSSGRNGNSSGKGSGHKGGDYTEGKSESQGEKGNMTVPPPPSASPPPRDCSVPDKSGDIEEISNGSLLPDASLTQVSGRLRSNASLFEAPLTINSDSSKNSSVVNSSHHTTTLQAANTPGSSLLPTSDDGTDSLTKKIDYDNDNDGEMNGRGDDDENDGMRVARAELLLGLTSACVRTRFDAGGNRLAAADADGNVRVWTLSHEMVEAGKRGVRLSDEYDNEAYGDRDGDEEVEGRSGRSERNVPEWANNVNGDGESDTDDDDCLSEDEGGTGGGWNNNGENCDSDDDNNDSDDDKGGYDSSWPQSSPSSPSASSSLLCSTLSPTWRSFYVQQATADTTVVASPPAPQSRSGQAGSTSSTVHSTSPSHAYPNPQFLLMEALRGAAQSSISYTSASQMPSSSHIHSSHHSSSLVASPSSSASSSSSSSPVPPSSPYSAISPPTLSSGRQSLVELPKLASQSHTAIGAMEWDIYSGHLLFIGSGGTCGKTSRGANQSSITSIPTGSSGNVGASALGLNAVGDGCVRVFDADTRRVVTDIQVEKSPHLSRISALGPSPVDSTLVVAASSPALSTTFTGGCGSLSVVDLTTGRTTLTFDLRSLLSVTPMAFDFAKIDHYHRVMGTTPRLRNVATPTMLGGGLALHASSLGAYLGRAALGLQWRQWPSHLSHIPSLRDVYVLPPPPPPPFLSGGIGSPSSGALGSSPLPNTNSQWGIGMGGVGVEWTAGVSEVVDPWSASDAAELEDRQLTQVNTCTLNHNAKMLVSSLL